MADDEQIEPPPTGHRGVSVEAERGAAMGPEEAVAAMRINIPARRNRILREVVARANADVSLRAWWHVANVNAVRRMRINDHSWVHIQVVANIGAEAAPRPHPQGRQVGDGRRLRHDQRGRRGGRRARRAVALRRHGRAPARARGLEPVHGRRPAARHARGPVRGADAHGRHRRGAAVHHLAPLRRRAAVARGRGRARRRRPRHGEGPLAHPVRRGPHVDPLAVGRGDRDGHHPRRRRAADHGRDRDEQLGRRLPDRRAAPARSCAAPARGTGSRSSPTSTASRRSCSSRSSASRPVDEARRARPPPAPREGPDGRALLRAARRGGRSRRPRASRPPTSAASSGASSARRRTSTC